jgi:hypothetical protein
VICCKHGAWGFVGALEGTVFHLLHQFSKVHGISLENENSGKCPFLDIIVKSFLLSCIHSKCIVDIHLSEDLLLHVLIPLCISATMLNNLNSVHKLIEIFICDQLGSLVLRVETPLCFKDGVWDVFLALVMVADVLDCFEQF